MNGSSWLKRVSDWLHFELEAPEVKHAERLYHRQLDDVVVAEEAYRKALIKIQKMEQLIDWRIGGY